MAEEFDTSELAWDIYRLLYNIDFELEEDNNSRQFFKFSVNNNFVNMSGDTDFNFGKGWAHSIFNKYKKYLDDSSDPKSYKIQLEKCQILYKSILNISAMPQTGNLQGSKKGIGNDRLDTFIWALSCYYNKENSLLFNNSTYDNTNSLKEYLNLFGTDQNSIYTYCNTIYGIDNDLVNEMIKSGKQAIDSPERVIDYMNLAYRFWQKKYDRINQAYEDKKGEKPQEKIEQKLKDVKTILDSFEKKV